MNNKLKISRTIMEEFSWERIKAALVRNEVQYQVGDVVISELRNENMQEWVITDLGKDYIRFEARDCIKDVEHEINKEWTNAGGIALSEMQGYLDNEIWALLPDDLQDVVSAVDRKYMDRKEEKIYQTKLFLPSVSEVFDEKNIYFGEGNLYEQLDYCVLLRCDYCGCGRLPRRELLEWRGPLLYYQEIMSIWLGVSSDKVQGECKLKEVSGYGEENVQRLLRSRYRFPSIEWNT